MNTSSSMVVAMGLRATAMGIAAIVVFLVLRRRGPKEGARAALAGLVALAGLGIASLGAWPAGWRVVVGGPETGATAMAPVAVVEASPRVPPNAWPDLAATGVRGAGGSPLGRPRERLSLPGRAVPDEEASGRRRLGWVMGGGGVGSGDVGVAEVGPRTPEAVGRQPRRHGGETSAVRADRVAPVWIVEALPWVFALGLGAGVVRLGAGLAAVARLRRAGRRIDDSSLECLFRQTCEGLRVRGPVELRELGGLGTPATVGWRRPLVLLPVAWRGWDEAARRAVLAHELAHVARRDYAAWVVARLCVAAQWYHPLAHWLAGRLRFEQELAADGAAAAWAGGRAAYRAALARLALERDARLGAGLARGMMAGGWTWTLSRRIEMLRATESDRGGRGAVALRYAGYAALVGCGAVLASLRPPGGPAPAQELRAAEALVAVEGGLSLAHVPDDASFVLAARPAAILARPEIKGLLDAFAEQPEVGRVLSLVDPASIEQVTVVVNGSPGGLMALLDSKPSDAQALLLLQGGLIVRTKTPRDWVAAAKGLMPMPIVEGRRAGHVYHTVMMDGPLGIGLYQPDERTLIVAPSMAIASFVAPRRPDAAPPWAAAWRSVADADVVLATDVASLIGPMLPVLEGTLAGQSKRSEDALAAMAAGMLGPLWEETEFLVVGVRAADQVGLELAAVCGDEAGAERVERTLEALRTLGSNTGKRYFPMVRRAALTGTQDREALTLLPVVDLGEQMLESSKIGREGSRVSLTMTSRTDVGGLIRLGMTAIR